MSVVSAAGAKVSHHRVDVTLRGGGAAGGLGGQRGGYVQQLGHAHLDVVVLAAAFQATETQPKTTLCAQHVLHELDERATSDNDDYC